MSIDEEYLQQLMRTLSHDMGGTLRCSVGFSKLLLENYSDVLDEKAIKWLNLIKADGEKTQGELVALSRYSRLYGVSDPIEDCDLAALSQQAIDNVGVYEFYSACNVKVGTLPRIKGYSRLWVDLFAELITNALKHNALKQSVKCDIYSRETEDGLEIIIADNGGGLSDKQKQAALQPFKCINNDDSKGVGMGLPIVKRIAEMHGGSILLEDLNGGEDGGDSGLVAIIQVPKSCLVS